MAQLKPVLNNALDTAPTLASGIAYNRATLKKVLAVSLLAMSPFLLHSVKVANAGTLLVNPDRGMDPDDAEFPSSSFGVGPAHGTTSGFASREVTDMEDNRANDDGVTQTPHQLRSARGIASVGNNPNSGGNTERTFGDDSNGNGAPIIVTQSSEMKTASQMARKGVQEVAVIASDLGYFPKTFFVSRDVPVRMFVTGSSKNTLCIMMDSFQVRKQIRAQKIEEITFTPNTPGKYRFYCPVNGMEGMMIVKDLIPTYAADSEGQTLQPRNQAEAEVGVNGTFGGRVFEESRSRDLNTRGNANGGNANGGNSNYNNAYRGNSNSTYGNSANSGIPTSDLPPSESQNNSQNNTMNNSTIRSGSARTLSSTGTTTGTLSREMTLDHVPAHDSPGIASSFEGR